MKTEFYELDNYINIDEPKLILLGGVKGVGKTTLLTNIATNLSVHQDIPVLFFSLEENYIRTDMKELNYDEFIKQIKDLPNNFCISDKIILKESKVSTDELRMIRSPYLGEPLNKESYIELYSAIEDLKQSKLIIRDEMPITINEIVQYIRESVEKEHIKVVILDNIKLIQYDKNQMFDGSDELKHSMEILKQLCAVFNITILIADDLEYFGNGNFKLSNYFKDEYTKMADVFMIMHRKNYDTYDQDKTAEIYISKKNSKEIDKIKLMYSDYNFQYLNMPNKELTYEQEEFKSRKRQLFKKIENNNQILLNPNEFDIWDITEIIEKEFKKQNKKYKICNFFETIAIEKLIDNELEEYIETFKDVEAVIFNIYTYELSDKIKEFVYNISKRISNTGIKKKCIYISDFYGTGFISLPEEFGQDDDDAIFF